MTQRLNDQSGAALILSLLLLLVMSLLAISSMQGTVMQERMVSAEREGMVSLEVAESAIRDAEIFIDGLTTLTGFNGNNGLFGMGNATPDPIANATWVGGNVRDATVVVVNGTNVTPRFFVEHVGDAENQENLMEGQGYSGPVATEAQAFRIVAWSPGVTGSSQRVIESFYTRQGF
ncbi:type IV pilus assembly protein PilX [Marinobacter daqiaonensis]|uniref:Type IV pilus assembly protein PilX n=1 Tax=Marinobacter daqiaonensis TaxID=650891 RepID=A0A1I6K5F7_9GAMM|nr:PilX N-terminal domain-containing pilus assembly protein [Marinobacter daqiaonensis]SFR86472.1 type IV pilus assembly protein PilX [Marinobacter daqiaonensis]